MLKRVKVYNELGRFETADQAKQYDLEIEEMLHDLGKTYMKIDADDHAAEKILQHVESL
jgi:hypothetical protein